MSVPLPAVGKQYSPSHQPSSTYFWSSLLVASPTIDQPTVEKMSVSFWTLSGHDGHNSGTIKFGLRPCRLIYQTLIAWGGVFSTEYAGKIFKGHHGEGDTIRERRHGTDAAEWISSLLATGLWGFCLQLANTCRQKIVCTFPDWYCILFLQVVCQLEEPGFFLSKQLCAKAVYWLGCSDNSQ